MGPALGCVLARQPRRRDSLFFYHQFVDDCVVLVGGAWYDHDAYPSQGYLVLQRVAGIFSCIFSFYFFPIFMHLALIIYLQTLEEAQEESGWKLVHGDVFRAPSVSPMLLSVLAGSGLQILAMVISTMVCALLGLTSASNRGLSMSEIVCCRPC